MTPAHASDSLGAYAAKAGASQHSFIRQSEAPFWVRARRNKLLARWTCDLTDQDNQNYLRLLLDEDFARWGDDAFLLLKIRNDLMGFGVFLTAEQMEAVLEGLEREARAQED